LAAQRGKFLQGMPLKFLERLSLIEKESDLLACEGFNPEQVLQALQHSLPLTFSPPQAAGGLVHPVHQHDALFLVHFLEADFHNLGVASLDGSADEGRLDGKLAMPAINHNAEPYAPRAPQIEKPVHGGAYRSARIQH